MYKVLFNSRDAEKCDVFLNNDNLCDNSIKTALKTCEIATYVERVKKVKIKTNDTNISKKKKNDDIKIVKKKNEIDQKNNLRNS